MQANIKIESITNDIFVAKGHINGRYFTGIADSALEALDKILDSHQEYVRLLFGTPANSPIGNIPQGMDHYAD